MRVSEYYELNLSQAELDFVDVDIVGDVQLGVDPRALMLLNSEWGQRCCELVRLFFTSVLQAIRLRDDERAKALLGSLREPNETHLGFSKGVARGRALGELSAEGVWEALCTSEAARTGLLKDLEDTVLMVPRIGPDIVSDIATNIIRAQLIAFTQEACSQYGIPLARNVASGPLWDPEGGEWHQEFTSLPVTRHGKLLLVPKVIVRAHPDYSVGEYYSQFVLEHMKGRELSAGSALVKVLKSGQRYVTKRSLIDKYGEGKAQAIRETMQYPQLLAQYRQAKAGIISPPPGHLVLAERVGAPSPDLAESLRKLRRLPTGTAAASEYEIAIEALVSAIFYPHLGDPRRQSEIHEGRKRIDIVYTNFARAGFFHWLTTHYRCPFVFVECKNYSTDPVNPELDQLSGRFAKNRGQFGLIFCRKVENPELLARRCRDTAQDGRGYILVVSDDDLASLVADAKGEDGSFAALHDRFRALVS